jgi:hypothetical protein
MYPEQGISLPALTRRMVDGQKSRLTDLTLSPKDDGQDEALLGGLDTWATDAR